MIQRFALSTAWLLAGACVLETTTAIDTSVATGTSGDDDGVTAGDFTEDGGVEHGSTGDCEVPEPPTDLQLHASKVKRFSFTWTPAPGAQQYQLLEKPHPNAPYVQVGPSTPLTAMSLTVPLHLRAHASYVVRACNGFGCTISAPVDVVGSLAEAVGYVKASNSEEGESFGHNIALSADGSTLAVGVSAEASSAVGIDGDQNDNSAAHAGAVYVFVRDLQGVWTQQAYVKASNTDAHDAFGSSVALSADGDMLAVGAIAEDSSAVGIGGNQADNSAENAGAVYVFVRGEQELWMQQAYVKASNTDAGDGFGAYLALSADGDTLAIAAPREDSSATGVNGDQTDNSRDSAGAVYVFVREQQQLWTQQAYIKAPISEVDDKFGPLALSGDGRTLAVGDSFEESNAVGVDGDHINELAPWSGAVYVFFRDDQDVWAQQAYVKASNTELFDYFGDSLTLSADGSTLAVGATGEDSSAVGIDGDQSDDSASRAGAVYVFARDAQHVWTQQAYVKASNTEATDFFGDAVALSGDGRTLAVGAYAERSNAFGIDGDQADNSAAQAGAVYVFVRSDQGVWVHEAYVKASNTAPGDSFGAGVALSGDGRTLAVGASGEDGGAAGVGGDQADDSVPHSGAVYLY